MQSNTTAELAAALAKAQGAMANATLNKINPHFRARYADLASVLDAARKPLSENGLAVTQATELRDGALVLVTTLHHVSGQWIASEFPLPASAKPQEMGSALTYARRYTLTALICNAADEDDDANAAESAKQKIAAPKPSAVAPQQIEPPCDPTTGEIVPHAIALPCNNGAPDWIAWAPIYIAGVKSSRTLGEADDWHLANQQHIDALAQDAPKVHKRMVDAVAKFRASLAPETGAVQ